MLTRLHKLLIRDRRIRVLTEHVTPWIGPGDHVLDIGSGTGKIAANLQRSQPLAAITGIDILIQPETPIKVVQYDGKTIPFPDKSFDTVIILDVLHHTENPGMLLKEAVRVAKNRIIIKDHFSENRLDHAILKFMDDTGNSYLGIDRTYNYYSRKQWHDLFKANGLTVEKLNSHPRLYTFPLSLFFDRGLHFVASLKIN
jgi:SAM-dependent methyltransferase